MKAFLRNNWLSLALILGAFVWARFQMAALPALIPTHFDVNGQPNGYEPRDVALMIMPAIGLFVVVLLGFVSKISPKDYKMADSQAIVGRFSIGLSFFLMLIYVAMILEAKNPGSGIFQQIFAPGFSVLMIFMGNYFGKVERNFFIGIRVPWTLASDENWRKTHRFAGKLFVAAGILSLVTWYATHILWISVALVLVTVPLAIGYSYRHFVAQGN